MFDAYWKRPRQILLLMLQRLNVVAIHMSIPNYVDEVPRTEICQNRKEGTKDFISITRSNYYGRSI